MKFRIIVQESYVDSKETLRGFIESISEYADSVSSGREVNSLSAPGITDVILAVITSGALVKIIKRIFDYLESRKIEELTIQRSFDGEEITLSIKKFYNKELDAQKLREWISYNED